MLFELPYIQICQSVVPWDSNWSFSPSKFILTYQKKLLSMKPIDMKLDMCDANVQKHQFSNLSAF